MNNDLISREALKKSMRKSINERYISWTKTITVADIATLIFDEIEYAPTVERPQDEQKCKTCNYYHPYFEQFTNIPRGDGYCVIARMTPEGLTTINCNDEFGCSDYQEKQGAKNVF